MIKLHVQKYHTVLWYKGIMISNKNIAYVLLVIFIILHKAAVAGERFVAGVTDLPLMPGFHLVHEETVIFEKPAGRFVHVVVTGEHTVEAFWQFYGDTLPQLGWHTVKQELFVRDGESLIINVEEYGSKLIARFTVVPNGKR